MTDVKPPTFTPHTDPLRAGREALARHAWLEAFEQLSQADRDGDLSAGADLEAVALASFRRPHSKWPMPGPSRPPAPARQRSRA
jgi:hypothetical protein